MVPREGEVSALNCIRKGVKALSERDGESFGKGRKEDELSPFLAIGRGGGGGLQLTKARRCSVISTSIHRMGAASGPIESWQSLPPDCSTIYFLCQLMIYKESANAMDWALWLLFTLPEISHAVLLPIF